MKTSLKVYPAQGTKPYLLAWDERSTSAGVPRLDVSAADAPSPFASVLSEARRGASGDLRKTISVFSPQGSFPTVAFPAAIAVPLAVALLMMDANPYAQLLINAVEEMTQDIEGSTER